MTWIFAKAQLSPVFQLLAAPSIAGRNVRETRKIAIRAIRGDTRYTVGVKGLEMYEVKVGLNHTVDGRNPAPVEVGSLSTIVYRVLAPSQLVVLDFWTINSVILPPHPGYFSHMDLQQMMKWFIKTDLLKKNSIWIYPPTEDASDKGDHCYMEERCLKGIHPFHKSGFEWDTVDGSNPAPPGMYKTL